MTNAPVVRLDDVHVELAGREILAGVTFTLEAGEFVGLIGPNGAGKTTLLRCILGLVRPSAGTVTVLGAPVKHGSRAIGYVPQRVNVDPGVPLTGWDMVALGFDGDRWGIPLPNARRRRAVDDVIERVGAAHFAHGAFSELSGGEQQRLLIAQALIADPRLILLDEPLASLDVRSANAIAELIARLARERGITVLLVAHDMNPLLPFMDRIVYTARGRVASGPVAEIVDEDVLSRLYAHPVSVVRIGSRVFVISNEDDAASDSVQYAGR